MLKRPLFALMLAALYFAAQNSAHALSAIAINLFPFTNAVTGGLPLSRLILGADGALYGTTTRGVTIATGATIFKINRDGSGFQILHSFGSISGDGSFVVPSGDNALIQGTDGAFYGTTPNGGTNGLGNVFRVTSDGSDFRILYNFDASQSDRLPFAGVIQASNGMLYGTTAGPSSSQGVLYRLNPDGGSYTVLTNLGAGSLAALLQGQDGALYGTTTSAVFRVALDGSGFTNLHTFSASDGFTPIGQLIQSTNGFMFGTAKGGGTVGAGTIFMLNTNGSGFQVLHNFFDGQIPGDGQTPEAGLALGPGNMFYGTTALGGDPSDPAGVGSGTVFRINQDGSGYQKLIGLKGIGVQKPFAGVVQGQAGDIGVLYGTTGAQSGSINGSLYAVIVSPPLTITPVTSQSVSNQVSVFWPAWALNYQLQSTTNIASANWVSVSGGTPVTGVQLPATNPGVFYRLVAPQ